MKILTRLLSSQVIEIAAGQANSTKGPHSFQLIREINTICGDLGVEKGEIWFSGNGSVTFSKEIPPAAHQPLRNVIVFYQHRNGS